MNRYVKKPIEIEAVQFNGQNADEIIAWAHKGLSERMNCIVTRDLRGLLVRTLEGYLHASVGDWIIKGWKGEFYPCKPDVFEATYNPVNSQEYVTTNP